MNKIKTTCKRGHLLTDDNVYTYQNRRTCKLCIKARKTDLARRDRGLCPQGHCLSGDNLYVYKGARSCKICRDARVRAHNLASKYGISIDEYNTILETQQGLCAICNQSQEVATVSGKTCQYLDVDHDHTTGQVRGLLCRRCNSALGFVGDDIDRAKAIVTYLTKWKQA